eukprot:6473913-Amphidinium_carterae.2
MRRECPDMSAEDAIQAMHDGSLSVSPTAPFAAVLDRELLCDAVIPGEHSQLESELHSIHERTARRDDCAYRVRQSVHLWEWRTALPKTASAKVSKPPREYSGGADDTDAMRVYLKTHGPVGTQ